MINDFQKHLKDKKKKERDQRNAEIIKKLKRDNEKKK
jgi:hypothetical protein